jgi:hypothetical protein
MSENKYHCKNCGKELKRTPKEIRRGRTKLCGRTCQSGEFNPRWNGGLFIRKKGYVFPYAPNHPRAKKNYVPEHVMMAEKAIGKLLPEGSMVHHVNGITTDNRRGNLVICGSQAYHLELHRRHRAFVESGSAHYRRCRFCKRWDDPKNLYISSNRRTVNHRVCHAEYENQRSKKAKWSR